MVKPLQRQLQISRSGLVPRFGVSRGNTITEYAIVGALVVVVSIIALQFLSGSLNTAMAMIRDDLNDHQQKALSAQLAQQKAASTGPVATAGLSAADQAVLEESLSQKLQTTGANGSTEILANQLAAAAAALLAQGKIDQSQYDILMQLSNQGHKIAQIESLIGQAEKMANGNYAAFANMKFTLDGQTYTAEQLQKMVGFEGPQPSSFAASNILTASDTAEPAMAQFLSLYQQAQASGALSDPLAQSTVNSASTQIASIGEVTEDTVWNFQQGAATDAASIQAFEASSATQMNSSSICTAGKFTDSGALCSP